MSEPKEQVYYCEVCKKLKPKWSMETIEGKDVEGGYDNVIIAPINSGMHEIKSCCESCYNHLDLM
mgnify:CR=1 FL=1